MSFSKDIERFNKKVMKRFIIVKKRAALGLFTNVIMTTPVLTGALRNNWQFNMGQPAETIIEGFDKSGMSVLSKTAQDMEVIDAYTTFYFTNNLPYIIPIEYDSYSAQAPNGIVRANIARWDQIVAAAAKGVK
jgi:hypothetical protein